MKLTDLLEAKIEGVAFLYTPEDRIIGKAKTVHRDAMIQAMKDLGMNPETDYDEFEFMLGDDVIEGFYTDTGEFLDREEAAKAVRLADYFKDKDHMVDTNYYDSEDVFHGRTEIKEAQFRKPIIMYHGTTTHALRSIMTHGVVPNPPAKYWDRDKDPGSEAFPSRASIGGSYWSTNMMTAWSSSTSAMRKFNSYPMIVCAMIREQAGLADEDSQTNVIPRAFAEMIHKVHPGLARDAYGVAAMYYYDDPQYREQMLEVFAKSLHDLLEGTGPLNRKLTDMVFEAFLMRIISHAMEKSARGSLYGIAYHLRKIKNQPEIPPTNVAEDNYARAIDLLTRRYKASAYKPEGGAGAHTLRTEYVIGFRGAQKIICILQLWDEESKAGPFDRPLILHYGKVPDDFMDQYYERISSSHFPGVMTPKGEWVIQPSEPIGRRMAAETANPIGKLYPIIDKGKTTEFHTIGYWFKPSTGQHLTVDWGLSDPEADPDASHHYDVFLKNLSLFGANWKAGPGFTRTDDVVEYANSQGWVRVGFNNRGQLSIDAASPRDGALTAQWIAKHHEQPITQIGLVVDGKWHDIKGVGVQQFMKTGRIPRTIQNLREVVRDDQDHGEALRQTGFWGRRGAGCIIIAKDTGRILLPFRSKRPPPGRTTGHVEQPHTWGTWGGAIDRGENPIEAAQREVQEEAGYRGPVQMIPLYVFKRGEFHYYNFLAVVQNEFEPVLDWETETSTWVYPGEWPQPLHFGLAALLKDPKSAHTIRTLRKKFIQGK